MKCLVNRHNGMHKIYVLKAVRKVFMISPVFFLMEYFFMAIAGISAGYLIYADDKLFASVSNLINGNSSLIVNVVKAVIVWGGINLIYEIAGSVGGCLGEIYCYKVIEKIKLQIYNSITKIKGNDYEVPEILTKLARVVRDTYAVRDFVNVVMDILVFYLPQFILTAVYLYKHTPILLAVWPCVIIPQIICQYIKSRYYIDYDEKIGELERKDEAYGKYLTSPIFVKDTICFSAREFFLKKYRSNLGAKKKTIIEMKEKSVSMDGVCGLVNLIFSFIIYLGLIWLVIKHTVTISVVAAIIVAYENMVDMTNEIFSYRLGEVSESYGMVKNYFEFVEKYQSLPNTDSGKETISEISKMEIQKVSFSYPQKEKAINDVSLLLEKNKTVAIVGENGSGKTTLGKVIHGLYEPQRGKIFINDSSEYGTIAKSVISQNYCQYKFTLGENIRISHPDRINENDCKTYEVLEKAGIVLNEKTFSDGIDTILARDYGGVDLSGGQWQKVAIARGIYKDSQLIVMDEPTAAIDPNREFELYSTLLEAARNRIGVIITHRLGIASHCDKIVFMKDGEILMAGTHEELLHNCEDYRKMWDAQAINYAM